MAYELITRHDSPNYTPAAKVPRVYGAARTIEAITVHHWGPLGQSFDAVVRYLCRAKGNTSAHEVIEAGRVAPIVNHRDAAWHAGSVKGNRTTIGLELRPEATDADYATAAERIRDLRATYGDLALVPHRAWKATACPGRWDLTRLDALARGALPMPGGGASVPVPRPAKPTAVPTTYPALLVDGRRGAVTVRAWQILLAAIDRYTGRIDGHWGPLSIRASQTWLASLGRYTGRIDGQEGPMTIKALQRHLAAKGLYTGHIDGRRGPLTVKAEQRYLNDQRRYL